MEDGKTLSFLFANERLNQPLANHSSAAPVYVRLSGETNPTWKSLFFSIEMTPIVGAKKMLQKFLE